MSSSRLILPASLLVSLVVLGTGFSPSAGLLACGCAIVVSGWLVHHAVGLHPRRLSIPSVWFLAYLAVAAVPAFFVVWDKDTPYVAPYLFGVFSTLIAVPAGMLLVNAATGFHRREIEGFFRAPVARAVPEPHQTAAYLVFIGVSLALTAAYLIEVPVIPLLYLIRNPGSAAILVGLREESFKLLDSPLLYAYDILRNVVYPFLIMVSLGYFLVSRQTRWMVAFLVTVSVGVFYAAATIAKIPVAVIVLTTILFLYLYVGGRVTLRTAVLGFVAVFSFPVLVVVQSLSGLGISLGTILAALFNRLFYLPAEILYHYFVIVPDVLPYLHGQTIGRFQWVLGAAEFDISNYVFRYMFPERIDTGTAPAAFIGYLHADFGVVGILAGSVVVGVVLQAIQLVLTRRPKTVVTLAAYAYMLWLAWKINAESFPQTVLSGGIIIIFVLVELLRLTESFFREATARPTAQSAAP